MKKLPLGVQTFEEIIEGGYVYADKTNYVYDLVSEGKAYFLSRPRRFGKSLLLSTFKSLFSGPPDPSGPPEGLFRDLWIGRESAYDFSRVHPVISLSMASDIDSATNLRESLLKKLEEINESEGLGLKITLPGTDWFFILKKLREKYDKKVVVLIDEYDAPVSDNIDKRDLAITNSEILKSFYSGFKDADEYLRFVFVTGVTRYAFMGLSAGLNHLNDITLNEKYAGICGFTKDEFKNCFSERLPIVLEKMKKKKRVALDANVAFLTKKINGWYDGYSWDGETMVLNPLSILKFLDLSVFADYWIQTNPSVAFLSKVAKENPLALLGNAEENVSQRSLGLAEVGGLGPVPALFQTGYLTVDKVIDIEDAGQYYTLKIPNLEIKVPNIKWFLDSFYGFLGKDPGIERDAFYGAISDRDAGKLTKIIDSVFAGLPVEHHVNNESCYHKVLYGYCHKFGRIVTPEREGAIGASDLLVIFPDGLYAVIELIFDKGNSFTRQDALLVALAQKALAAIEAKDYWRPYQAEAKETVKIGLGVSWRGQCLALIESERGEVFAPPRRD
ncbi:MAG: ATP-binding protein [Deltaproteobacteria bacterium]|jgi:hypothetical protein|nr:ATP-binding protein [Deltaproteobacteria bacterium]